jgi:hypothetical protein
VLGERIAAEHDMALGPVLRNSGVSGSSGFLSAQTRRHTQDDGEPHRRTHCNSTIRTHWVHGAASGCDWIAAIVAAFRSRGDNRLEMDCPRTGTSDPMFQAGNAPQRTKTLDATRPTPMVSVCPVRISDSKRGVEQSKTWNNEDVGLSPINIHIHHP